MSLILDGTNGLSDVDGTAATPAIRGTDANTGIFFPAADTIAFSEGGAESMRITSTGAVGIGTTSPNDVLTVGGSDAFIRIDRTANEPGIDMRVGGSASNRGLIAVTTGGAMYFTSGGATERMRINAGAPILCLAGGSTTATGTGIAFPATQSASSDANTLDDYEEGTWTPGLSASGISAVVYNSRNGFYTKIGNIVTVRFALRMTSFSGGSGDFSITGLPFTSSNPNGDHIGVSTLAYENVPIVSTEQLIAVIDGGATAVRLLASRNNTGWIGYTPLGSFGCFGSFSYGV